MNYPRELDFLLEKAEKNSKTENYLLFTKNYCIELNNEMEFLRNQKEFQEISTLDYDDDSDEVCTYEDFQEMKAENAIMKEEIEDLKNKIKDLEDELYQFRIQSEIEQKDDCYDVDDDSDEVCTYEDFQEMKADLEIVKEENEDLTSHCESLENEIEDLEEQLDVSNNKLNNLEELSANSVPISVNVHIDSADRISDELAQKNDGYNKILIFSTFVLQQRNNGLWVRVDNQPGFLITHDKTTNYRALFDDPNKRYIIATNSVTHQLIVNDKTFQEFISDTGRKRMFTFIEYNEAYNSKHAKNFNYNCDQAAAVLLPYIWKQLPTEDRIKLNNFIKIITVFKFDNNGIKADQFRFVIIYKNSDGKIDYYEVDKNIKFKKKIIFILFEQNLFC